MSVLDRIFGAAKSVIELRVDVDQSAAQIERNTDQLFDHEKRLIHIETLIQLTGERSSTRSKRLSKR